jgi:hypothetical protein
MLIATGADNTTLKYVLDSVDPTATQISSFLKNYGEGLLKPYFKSQALPSEPKDNDVVVIVG